MDSIFLLDEADRINFLHLIVQSFGCTYICLWSYVPAQHSNFLIFKDGLYKEESNQSSSSSGSLARRLFGEYQKTPFTVDNDRVPGFAFKNSFPYVELKELDLLGLASIEAQLQFYREARIKTAIFMGCKNGEIEMGMSHDIQANLEMKIKQWFPDNFPAQGVNRELPIPTDQNRPSSSSSSLRSLSIDSPEYAAPPMFNAPTTSFFPENPKEAPIEQAVLLRPSTSVTTSPLHQAIQALSQIRSIQFPTIECEDAAMTKAILAVISSPCSSSSSHQPRQSFLPHNYQAIGPNASAFRSYTSALAPSSNTRVPERIRRQNILKRSVAFFRSLSSLRTQEQGQGGRHTTTQLHHMISERRRREKLNESFQALRSLLPPGSKKDKASVLTSTTEYLGSLKAQVSELSRRNQLSEARLAAIEEAKEDANMGLSNDQGLNVRLTHTDESNSKARFVDLQVAVRAECSLQDLTIRILEFLKRDQNVSLMSAEANTQMVDSASVSRLNLRLKIEGGEWDESAFQEAVKRVVADLAK